MKESAARMENIPSTMVLHKHVDWEDTIISTMEGPLANNPLGKWLGMIRRGIYQASSEDSRWSYEPASDFWTNIEPDSDSSYGGSSDEVIKYQDNLEDKEKEDAVFLLRRNTRRL